MASVRTPKKRIVGKLLTAVKQLTSVELQQFERGFIEWIGQAKARNWHEMDEDTLLETIRLNTSLPAMDQRRFNRLRRKLQAEQLLKPEEKELQSLWQRAERMTVTRLRALAELARRRGTDVKSVMRQLGIPENKNAF